jgi:HAMP domain-containing protein
MNALPAPRSRPGRRLRLGLGVRLAAAFLTVIGLATGAAALIAHRSGGEDFRSYVAARGLAGGAGMGAGLGAGGGSARGMGPGMAMGPWQPMHTLPEEWFLVQLDRSLWIAASVGGAAALLASLFITRRLVQPVVTLQRAARSMAGGDLETRVNTHTGDEFEELLIPRECAKGGPDRARKTIWLRRRLRRRTIGGRVGGCGGGSSPSKGGSSGTSPRRWA